MTDKQLSLQDEVTEFLLYTTPNDKVKDKRLKNEHYFGKNYSPFLLSSFPRRRESRTMNIRTHKPNKGIRCESERIQTYDHLLDSRLRGNDGTVLKGVVYDS
jgi:hypothetical protein